MKNGILALSLVLSSFALAFPPPHHGPHHGPGWHPIPVPVPRPPQRACGLIAGNYYGTCRANAGSSVISFTVIDQGFNCLVTNSTYFAPAQLAVSGGAGYATNLVGTGVAINNTQLVVYGNGQFRFTGYNYAGHFNFVCSP